MILENLPVVNKKTDDFQKQIGECSRKKRKSRNKKNRFSYTIKKALGNRSFAAEKMEKICFESDSFFFAEGLHFAHHY